VESLVVEVDILHKPLLKASELLLILIVMMINPYSGYHGAYGGGDDDRVER
jgi:hypothetical protein